MDIRKLYTVEIGHPIAINVVLAGCGGTGSFLALHLARLAYHARERRGLDVRLIFVDPDVVEPANLGRQNFCPAELGRPKAIALMERYNRAFGLAFEASVEPFDPDRLDSLHRDWFHVVCGCVDNAAARVDVHRAVARANGRLWWLDCGNHEHSGQVLLGNRTDLAMPEISPLGFCAGLPAPGVQHPELLQPPPPLAAAPEPGCADLALADAQSLMINQAVAGWAANYVTRLVLSRDLDVYATYLDLQAGSVRSLGITTLAGKGGWARA